MDTQENKFLRYTDEELRMWIWSQELTPTSHIRNEKEYQEAIAEKDRRIKELLKNEKMDLVNN